MSLDEFGEYIGLIWCELRQSDLAFRREGRREFFFQSDKNEFFVRQIFPQSSIIVQTIYLFSLKNEHKTSKQE